MDKVGLYCPVGQAKTRSEAAWLRSSGCAALAHAARGEAALPPRAPPKYFWNDEIGLRALCPVGARGICGAGRSGLGVRRDSFGLSDIQNHRSKLAPRRNKIVRGRAIGKPAAWYHCMAQRAGLKPPVQSGLALPSDSVRDQIDDQHP